VTHPAGFLEGDLDHLLDPRGRDDLLDDDALVATEDRLDRLADFPDLDAQVVEDLGGEALAFAQKAQEKVLSTDVAVVGPFGFLLGEREYFLRSLSEPREWIHGPSSWTPSG